MRGKLLRLAVSLFSGGSLLAFASCAEDGERAPVVVNEASDGTTSFGETGGPPGDEEPSEGNVCGLSLGLDPAAPWPLRGGCTTRAGWSSRLGPRTTAVSSRFLAPVAESSPVVASTGLVWMGSTEGDVFALTRLGEVQCALRTGGSVSSSAAIDVDGHAVIGSADGFLYALSCVDGEAPEDAGLSDSEDAGADAGVLYPAAKIHFALSVGPIASSPVIADDGTIYVGTTDGKLVAVPKDGSAIAWTASTHDTLGSSPALGQDGTIYVGSTDGFLYAFAPSGASTWKLDLGAPVHGSPAVGGDGSIYVGTSDGRLHAVDSKGAERWSYATEGEIVGTPAVYAGSVYVGSTDKKLHAVSTRDGAALWSYATLGAVATPVIGSDGTVYVGSADARLYAITAKGSLFFAVNVRGPVKSAPAIDDGLALWVTTDRALVVVGF